MARGFRKTLPRQASNVSLFEYPAFAGMRFVVPTGDAGLKSLKEKSLFKSGPFTYWTNAEAAALMISMGFVPTKILISGRCDSFLHKEVAPQPWVIGRYVLRVGMARRLLG